AIYPRTSTGRRTALARWIVSRENPLTARVAVNHVWLRHFGSSLVESVFDFGRRTPKPLHQDLLDALALDFIESGWDLKRLHRLMLTSKTYQQHASSHDADENTFKQDPDNRHYWRMNSRRMEAQVVRDSLLALSGDLDLTLYGPSLDVNKNNRRRSIYFKHSRDDKDLFLQTFDDADLMQCYRRSETVAPQQALALSNSRLSHEAARKIAATIPEPFIEQAFETMLARPPSDEEKAACETFMSGITQPRVRLIHVLLNHNDFITIR
ncbi:MAG: DUF1553 domain-containing protein, partial [Verrucomicrobiota bacterium]